MFCHLETDGFLQESTHGILFGTFLFGTEGAFRRPMTNGNHPIPSTQASGGTKTTSNELR